MEQKFKKILQKSKAWQEGSDPLSKSFEGALFIGNPWPFFFSEEQFAATEDSIKKTSVKTLPQQISPDSFSTLVLFIGDSYNPEIHSEDLLGKMINAMKLQTGEYHRFAFNEALEDINNLEENLVNPSTETLELFKKIIATKPAVVVSLGATVTNVLLGKRDKLSSIHGQFLPKIVTYNDQSHSFNVTPLFHPDFLLINPNMKRTAWIDLQLVMERVGKI